MKLILNAVKEALLSFTPARSLIESMMKYDFRIGEPRGQLMQLCFSNLAAWPLALVIALVAWDPFGRAWSLVAQLGFESPVVLFLLNGRPLPMLAVFALMFFLEWIFRKEYILLGLVFYLLGRSELHIHLATVAVLGVYLARICYLWWLAVDCESRTRRLWQWASSLQLLAWGVAAVMALNALDYLQVNHLFNEAGGMSRFRFLILVVGLYHVFSHLFLCLWGHFSFQRAADPAQLPVYYSTAAWILRFSMSHHLQNLLRGQVAAQLEKHQAHQRDLAQLKSQSPGLATLPVGEVLQREILHLKEANLRLTRI